MFPLCGPIRFAEVLKHSFSASIEETKLVTLYTRIMATVRSVLEDSKRISIGSMLSSVRVLIVDSEVRVRDVLESKLTDMGYACECCDNYREAWNLLAGRKFDLMLADVSIPQSNGPAILREALDISPDIAVILLTSVVNIEAAVDSLKEGAYDYLAKPFTVENVSLSVTRALEKRRLLLENQNYQHTLEERVSSRTFQLQEALGVLEHTYHSTLVALSKAIDSRDAGSEGHSLRATVYATRLARQLGMSASEIKVVEQGVLLHDIGKIGIPDAVLRKTGSLNPEELLLMQKHPEIGSRILSNIKFLRREAQLVLHHHEMNDGSGYPGGLKGNAIHPGARICAIVEMLDELTWNRPLHPAVGFTTAVGKIEEMSGARLDPDFVREFLKIPAPVWESICRAVSKATKRSGFLRKVSNQ